MVVEAAPLARVEVTAAEACQQVGVPGGVAAKLLVDVFSELGGEDANQRVVAGGAVIAEVHDRKRSVVAVAPLPIRPRQMVAPHCAHHVARVAQAALTSGRRDAPLVDNDRHVARVRPRDGRRERLVEELGPHPYLSVAAILRWAFRIVAAEALLVPRRLVVNVAASHHPRVAQLAVVAADERFRDEEVKDVDHVRVGAQVDAVEVGSVVEGCRADDARGRRVGLMDGAARLGEEVADDLGVDFVFLDARLRHDLIARHHLELPVALRDDAPHLQEARAQLGVLEDAARAHAGHVLARGDRRARRQYRPVPVLRRPAQHLVDLIQAAVGDGLAVPRRRAVVPLVVAAR